MRGYICFEVRNFINTGKSKVAKGSTCGKCHEAFRAGQALTCHTVQTAAMPALAFYYYHTHCAPQCGSGWGKAMPGVPVTRPDQVEVGDVLLEYCRQFDSYNVVLVTKTDFSDRPANTTGKMFYAVFIAPETMGNKKPKARQGGDDEFCIWDHEIADPHEEAKKLATDDPGRRMRREFYRPILKRPQFYKCGSCGLHHPADFTSDCRDDDHRFAGDVLDATYGQQGWVEVDQEQAV